MELNDWLAITGALRDWKLSAGVHILCKPQNARKDQADRTTYQNIICQVQGWLRYFLGNFR